MGRRAVGLASEAGWRILARSGSRTSTLSGDHDWAQRPWGALRPGGTVTNGTRPGPPGQLSVQAGEPGREERPQVERRRGVERVQQRPAGAQPEAVGVDVGTERSPVGGRAHPGPDAIEEPAALDVDL